MRTIAMDDPGAVSLSVTRTDCAKTARRIDVCWGGDLRNVVPSPTATGNAEPTYASSWNFGTVFYSSTSSAAVS